MAESSKLTTFRQAVQEYLRGVPASPLNHNAFGTEPWYRKDLFQLLTELLLLADLSRLQKEVLVIVTQGVIHFGRDTTAIVGLLLTMRAQAHWGRGAAPAAAAELAWLSRAVMLATTRAEQYVHSEHFGDLNPAQVIEGL